MKRDGGREGGGRREREREGDMLTHAQNVCLKRGPQTLTIYLWEEDVSTDSWEVGEGGRLLTRNL